MKNLLLSQLFVLGLMVILHSEAFACSCLRQEGRSVGQQVTRAKAEAAAVFSARVLAVSRDTQTLSVSVKLSVKQIWKGKLAKEVTLTTGSGGGDCGYPFKIGESYLIYGFVSEDEPLSTNICTRTNKLSASAQDVKILGKGTPAATTVSPPQDDSIENGFRGIKPLRTKKEFVDSLFGTPKESDPGDFNYDSGDVFMHATYSAAPCEVGNRGRGAYRVPPNTVLYYEVRFRNLIELADLKGKLQNYRKEVDSEIDNLTHYHRSGGGVLVTTYTDERGEYVRRIMFRPSDDEDKNLRCK